MNKKFFKRLISTVLVSTLTINAGITAYGSGKSEENYISTTYDQQGFESVIQCENFDIQCGSSNINGNVSEMDDIVTLHDGIMSMLDEETVINTNDYIGRSEISNESDVYSVNMYNVNAGTINLSKVIVAENDIGFGASQVNGENAILYSKNGDINFYCGNVDFTGIIYAPNGTVVFEGSNIDIDGVIIAKEVIVRAGTFTLDKNESTAALTDELEYIRYDILMQLDAYHDAEQSRIILEWIESDNISSVDIYARYDDETFQKIDTVSGQSYYTCADESLIDNADYMIVVSTIYGESYESEIVTLVRDEDLIYEDVIDTDEDGIPDGYEILEGTNVSNTDTDSDGLSDSYELLILCTDPLTYDEDKDYDDDSLSNYVEMVLGTNPYNKDSDFDGIKDSDDKEPLHTDTNSGREVIYDVAVQEGKFDLVTTYIDEEGNRCKSVYNHLTGQSKMASVGENKSIAVYDSKGNITAYIVHADGKYVANTYEYEGDKIVFVTRNGFQYEFAYDEKGNVTDIKIGDRTVSAKDYSGDIVKSELLGNGWLIDYNYDEDGNITSYNENGVPVYRWYYDESGRNISSVDLIENITYTYEYDDMGMISAIKADNGFSISYNLSEENYTVKYVIGNTEKQMNFDLTIEEECDSEQLLEETESDVQYTYDNNGNIIAVTENDEEKLTYAYDGFNQLIREDNLYVGKTITYEYDDAGNILRVDEYVYTKGEPKELVNSKVYSYDDSQWKDLMTEFAGEKLTYDGVGNPLSYRGGMQLGWSGKKLTSVQKSSDVISYTYNCDGIRTSKTVNGKKTVYYLDGTRIVAEETDDEIVWYTYDRNGEVVGFEYKNNTYFFEKNSNDDIMKIVDEAGNVISEYVYDTWGNVVTIEGHVEIAKLNPFRYRGYYYDNETDLYYIESRYYDPTTGRFVSADVLFDNGGGIFGSNMYTYCVNNPMNMKDVGGYAPAYITDQSENGSINGVTYTDIPVGLRGNLRDNGCGAIAAYNVLISKGINVTIYNVLKKIALYGGFIAHGLGGITPGSISLVLCNYFYYVKICTVKSGEWVQNQKIYDAVIILYASIKTQINVWAALPVIPGAHYVAGIRAEKLLGTGGFYRFYNSSLKYAGGLSVDGVPLTINNFLQYVNKNGRIPVWIICVKGKK